jgi:hypothetical protein
MLSADTVPNRTVIVGDDLPRGQHEVVADGGMCVRIVLRRQSVGGGERVEIRHGRIANDL